MTPDPKQFELGPMRPLRVDGIPIAKINAWSVVDRWWTEDPIHRDFLAVELEDGSQAIIQRESGPAWKRVE